jgi:ssDNA-binding replication factor A large subunit
MQELGEIKLINMPLETIREKIREKTGLSDEEIDQRIRKKLDQLSGLISREGAAHIVANELGVRLQEAQGAVKVKNILAGMKNIELSGKAIRKYDVREFKTEKREGKLAKFLIADETGTTLIVLWNDKADLLATFGEGDILRVKGASARENNGRVELHLTDSSTIEVNPEGVDMKVEAGGAEQQFQRPAVTRKKIKDLGENDRTWKSSGRLSRYSTLSSSSSARTQGRG